MSFEQIDRLTMPELALALDQDLEKSRPPSGANAVGRENVLAYLAWRRSLTPRQKLEAYRKGIL